MKALSGARLHQLNSVLLLVALLLALVWPFETFLLAYAVLGPLHYLTEISWLHDRKYFLPRGGDRAVLWIGLAVLVLAFCPVKPSAFMLPLVNHRVALMFAVFCAVPVLLFVQRWTHRMIAAIAVAALWWGIQGHALDLILDVYLATLIHVFVFTGVFAWNGVRRHPDRAGAIFLALFLLCPLLCLALPVDLSRTALPWAQRSYGQVFAAVNRTSLLTLGTPITLNEVFTSAWSIRLTRFIALAYTYHYFNWFSKPTVIQWHRISASRWLLILGVWAWAVAIYAYDYAIGFIVLLTLSFAHVVLEFPLNHLSFKQMLTGWRPGAPRTGSAQASVAAAIDS